MKGITFSLVSGLLAATASLCGKFSMAAEETLDFCEAAVHYLKEDRDDLKEDKTTAYSYSPPCHNIIISTRIGFFFAMLLSNALMWTLFTKALRLCSTTLEATVTNTAANFFFTAVYGQVFFKESLTLLWWLGTMMIIVGLLLMHQGSQGATCPCPESEKVKKK